MYATDIASPRTRKVGGDATGSDMRRPCSLRNIGGWDAPFHRIKEWVQQLMKEGKKAANKGISTHLACSFIFDGELSVILPASRSLLAISAIAAFPLAKLGYTYAQMQALHFSTSNPRLHFAVHERLP
jgi:hypothetical protein